MPSALDEARAPSRQANGGHRRRPPRGVARRRAVAAVVFVTTLGALFAAPSPAAAAAVWVFRPITAPRGQWSLDMGGAIAHREAGPNNGTGLNLEMAAGLTSDLTLGLRVGVRFGMAAREMQADGYARLFDSETWGTNGDAVSNPELRLRWALARGGNVQIAFETRMYLPTETGSRFGVMVALPLWLRAGALRIDTGVYAPILFYDQTRTAISVPVQLWIQASGTLWLGPLFGVRYHDDAPGSYTTYPFGFGLGTAVSGNVDLKLQVQFRDISQEAAARRFGVGAGLQIRFD